LAESDNLYKEVQSYTDIKKKEAVMLQMKKGDKETVIRSSGASGKKMKKKTVLCQLRKERGRLGFVRNFPN